MKLKRHVSVHFEIIAAIGDQPERRSLNYLMLGNSTYSSRFCYTANMKEVWNFFQCVTAVKKE